MPFFKLTHQDKHTRARVGIIRTDHGDIETPAFMPVGTQASVKTLDQKDLEALGAQIILGNTYHLHLRPGEDTMAELGGLHKFMNWNRPILTDSGGFQVFSLSSLKHKNINTQNDNKKNNRLVKIDEDGVTFHSHIDGSKHRFTPESSIEIQHKLGADIIMAFDECTPDNADYEYTKKAMERTHQWAKRCLNYHRHSYLHYHSRENGNPCHALVGDLDPPLQGNDIADGLFQQHLFGIIQGAGYRDLREESARFISSLDFDGIAIGGESIGYNMEATKQILDWVIPMIPEDKPHYAMGLGLSPLDLFEVVERGIDMFDCVAPTRLARHGMLYTATPSPRGEGYGVRSDHRLNITNSVFSRDTRPIDESCSCPTCHSYTRAYLRHLFRANELSALRLATIHNIHFFLDLMRRMREAIKEDRFLELKKEWSLF